LSLGSKNISSGFIEESCVAFEYPSIGTTVADTRVATSPELMIFNDFLLPTQLSGFLSRLHESYKYLFAPKEALPSETILCPCIVRQLAYSSTAAVFVKNL